MIFLLQGKGSLWYAEEEEKKGANAGNLRDAIDRSEISTKLWSADVCQVDLF